jgi:hypothetical protein
LTVDDEESDIKKIGQNSRQYCQKRCGLLKITRNNWKQKNFKQYRFPVVSRDFDKPAAFLVPTAFLAEHWGKKTRTVKSDYELLHYIN